ncbi:MAG: hypothetical protein OEQ13_01170 [Acidobacteriota bacterium]|nr:hypothetical protein [Acidobacteriota bacterium]
MSSSASGSSRTDRTDLLREVAHRCGGENLYEVPHETRPGFMWLHGSTLVELQELSGGGVSFRAHLVLRPSRRSLIPAALLRRTVELTRGYLVLDEDGDVALVHLIPATLDDHRLRDVIVELCGVADRLDDQLCAELGGQRSLDRFHAEVMQALVRVDGERISLYDLN